MEAIQAEMPYTMCVLFVTILVYENYLRHMPRSCGNGLINLHLWEGFAHHHSADNALYLAYSDIHNRLDFGFQLSTSYGIADPPKQDEADEETIDSVRELQLGKRMLSTIK